MSIEKVCLFVLLAFFLTRGVAAQDNLKYSTISLRSGTNHVMNKDLFQSPYTYKGTNLAINSTYSYVGAKGKHILDLAYSRGEIKSIVSPQAENRVLIFKYDYLFKLKTKTTNEKLLPSLGFGFHTLLNNTNYLLKIESPKNYLSGGAFLTASGEILYYLSKRKCVGMQIALPLFGLVYRPDFEINGKSLTKTTLLGKSNLLSINLEYEYQLTTKLNFIATYQYSYFTFAESRPITILQNSLLIGLRKTF